MAAESIDKLIPDGVWNGPASGICQAFTTMVLDSWYRQHDTETAIKVCRRQIELFPYFKLARTNMEKMLGTIYEILMRRYGPGNKPVLDSDDPDVIVSFTTWGDRLRRPFLRYMVESLATQRTSLKIRIALTLYKDDAELLAGLPDLELYLKSRGVEVIVADTDLKSHLKYFYAMRKHPGTPIITVDDDNLYCDTLVQGLYDNYVKYPRCVSAYACGRITGGNGKASQSTNWMLIDSLTNYGSSLYFFPCGWGGVLYPPGALCLSDADIPVITGKALYHDDMFLFSKELDMGIETCRVMVGPEFGRYTTRGISGSYTSDAENKIQDATALQVRHDNAYRNQVAVDLGIIDRLGWLF